MKKTAKKNIIPDITEFTDDDGKKWVQTSTDDLFSIKELNEILESIENEGKSDEIILARIDFQKVNKEYYEKASELQKKLRLQGDLMKKFIAEAREKIDRKNRKLNELIEYIKKLHLLLAHISVNEEDLKKLKLPAAAAPPEEGVAEKEVIEQVYEAVDEVVLPQEHEAPQP